MSCTEKKIYQSDLMVKFTHEKLDSFDWDIFMYKVEIDTLSSETNWNIKVYRNFFKEKCCDCFIGDVFYQNDTLELFVYELLDEENMPKCEITVNGIETSIFEYKLKKDTTINFEALVVKLDSTIWYPLCK